MPQTLTQYRMVPSDPPFFLICNFPLNSEKPGSYHPSSIYVCVFNLSTHVKHFQNR